MIDRQASEAVFHLEWAYIGVKSHTSSPAAGAAGPINVERGGSEEEEKEKEKVDHFNLPRHRVRKPPKCEECGDYLGVPSVPESAHRQPRSVTQLYTKRLT